MTDREPVNEFDSPIAGMAMNNVVLCLLSAENNRRIGDCTIGALIKAGGREHLWEERRNGSLDTIVIHYISAAALAPRTPFEQDLILKIFCDYGVSSHYLIDREGALILLVPEEKRAWHCGGSIMPEPDNRLAVNEFSIGIELMATPDSGFTMEQYRSLCGICADIELRHQKRFIYVGHDQIAGIRAVSLGLRKDAKIDPGDRFDWTGFRECLGKLRQNGL